VFEDVLTMGIEEVPPKGTIRSPPISKAQPFKQIRRGEKVLQDKVQDQDTFKLSDNKLRAKRA
jgi:hypothetical protein